MLITLIRILIQFGPAVIKLLVQQAPLLQQAGAGKDDKKAERVTYVMAWKRAHNLTGRPPVPPRPEEQ